ncbi:MAG: polyprenyl synthetase family protein [Candidatus Thorarchaeota archaeon]|jgi:geranylgeranyl pyrophosphate synthase
MPEYGPSAFKHRHHAEKSTGRISKQDEAPSIPKEDISKADDLFESEELKSRMELVTREIKRVLVEEQGEPEILYETARHLLLAGGKRLRSLIVILSCEAVGGDIEKVLPFAVAAELIQTASLIHDDVIDEDSLRRGVQTAHEKFGQKMAVIAGDLLVAQAIKLIGKYATPEILMYVGIGGIKMCEGEAADLLICADKPETFNKQNYLRVIEQKTVAFIKTAARLGAIVGNGTKTQQEALVRFAELIGYGFQIRDDTLDLVASQNEAGKTVLSDLRWKRCNYPLVHALEVSSESDRQRCLQSLSKGDLGEVLEIIQKTGAIEHANVVASGYIENAKKSLKGLDFENEDLLIRVADFVLHRHH